MTVFRAGDRVSISCEGRTLAGTVALASPNGRSLVLEFEGLLGGYVGVMPVLEIAGVFLDLLQGRKVDVRRSQAGRE
jgi:hypothetical protein